MIQITKVLGFALFISPNFEVYIAYRPFQLRARKQAAEKVKLDQVSPLLNDKIDSSFRKNINSFTEKITCAKIYIS